MDRKRFLPLVFNVFRDYKRCRDAIIRALTSDFEEFREQCDPEKGKLCLYGRSDGRWFVNPPEEEVPTNLPEPFSFISFARDRMEENEWISYIAAHSDAWLVSVASFKAGRQGFDKAAREFLFSLTNDLPTVSEVVKNAAVKKQSDDNKQMSNSQVKTGTKFRFLGKCGICKEDEFWIFCDACHTWFHGKCVKITPFMAGRMENYKCPPCSKGKKACTG